MNQPRNFKAQEYCDPNYGPMIEVLVDGRNWRSVFGWDEHFQFGLTKAKMVLATLPIIEEFCNYNGRRPPLGRKIRIFGDDIYGVMSECIRYDQFKTSFGSTVNKAIPKANRQEQGLRIWNPKS